MNENNVQLDINRWNHERIDVSARIIQARSEQDPHFRTILQEAKQHNIYLYHYDKCPKSRPSFWGAMKLKEGGIIGENTLGKQMMALDI